MNKELLLIQLSKYITIGTISVILGMIIALVCLWILSEWLIYQQKKNVHLDKVRDKMDGIELKRLIKQQQTTNETAILDLEDEESPSSTPSSPLPVTQ